jgi:hypothetical protein
MTGRDRIVLVVLVVVVLLGGVYLKLVSPERKKAAKLAGEITQANAALATTESQLAEARNAQTRYATAYTEIVELGKVVPAEEEVPALIFQLGSVSHVKDVKVSSITAGSGPGGGGPTSASASTATAAAAPTSFTSLPFTFTFEGGYFELAHLLEGIEGFTKVTSSGVQVSGRLLTIEGVTFAQGAKAITEEKGSKERLTATVTASAYVLPPGQSSTGGGSPSTPSPSTPSPASSSSSSPTTPAVARVTP